MFIGTLIRYLIKGLTNSLLCKMLPCIKKGPLPGPKNKKEMFYGSAAALTL